MWELKVKESLEENNNEDKLLEDKYVRYVFNPCTY